MKIRGVRFGGWFAVLVAPFIFAAQARAVDIAEIERLLGSTGVNGWVHGSVGDRNLFVFTYRNPNDFFDYIQMSLVPADAAMLRQLRELERNDEILVKGSFMRNPSPQKHIKVTSATLVKKFEPAYPVPAYRYEGAIPDELLNITKANFLVHAVGGEGKILVVEYKDQVIPVYVKKPELTKNLYRNDVIELNFKIQRDPNRPTHLQVVVENPEAVKVIDAVKDLHGKPAQFEGALILFPKSPEIKTNVFAVEQKLASGLTRQFTLANLEDRDVFIKIREKLQKAWDEHPGEYVNGRNKRTSTKLRVKATGVYNEVDASQANVQIILSSPDNVEVISN